MAVFFLILWLISLVRESLVFATGWTVRRMLLQVTFFPGRRSISKAVSLLHGHVWLVLLFCSVSPSLRPQWLYTQLIQTHTQTQRQTHIHVHRGRKVCLSPSTNSVTSFLLYSWYSLTHTHTLTDPWQLTPLVPSQNLLRWWKQLRSWSQSRLKSDQNSSESQLGYYDSMETSLLNFTVNDDDKWKTDYLSSHWLFLTASCTDRTFCSNGNENLSKAKAVSDKGDWTSHQRLAACFFLPVIVKLKLENWNDSALAFTLTVLPLMD